jgi:hypothetical protein
MSIRPNYEAQPFIKHIGTYDEPEKAAAEPAKATRAAAENFIFEICIEYDL